MSEGHSSRNLSIVLIVLVLLGALGFSVLKSQESGDVASADAGLPQPEIIENVVPDVTVVDTILDTAADRIAVVATPEAEKMVIPAPIFDGKASLNDGTSLPARGIGDPNAPVYIVEYSSLTCSHCAHFHKETLGALKEKYIDTGKVYMVFREFPLNKAALVASQILRCVPEERHYAFMNLLFGAQDQWAFSGDYLSKLKQNAKLAGLSEEQINTCLADKDLETKLTESLKVGTDKYNVRSTPSFVVNGGAQLISGNQKFEFFEKVINDLLPTEETDSK
ncbi:MAG: DsbA family protein [Alphaproteobacteria bacterium]|nr:DsbA family protein [Alphaproteobacteria bacterium]